MSGILINGTAGADYLSAGAGDDTLNGGAGADTLEGGPGRDTALYSGNRGDYTITMLANGDVTVQDTRGGAPDGTDLLRGIDTLQFADTQLVAAPLERTVSSTTAGSAYYQASAMLLGTGGNPSEGYVMAFRADDASGGGIYLRRFGPDGSPLGDDVAVNTTIAGDQRAPTVTALLDGGFVVAWDSNPKTQAEGITDIGAWEIKLQRYDASGNAVGAEVDVNTTTAGQQRFPSVVATSDGGYLAVWQSRQDNGGADNGIYGQKFNASGDKVGAELHINTTVASNQASPMIRPISTDPQDGGSVVVWLGNLANGNFGYAQQLLDANGNKVGAERTVFELTAGVPSAFVSTMHESALSSGGYVLTWSYTPGGGNPAEIMARVYNADGTPKGAAFTAAIGDNYNSADVINLDGDKFMLVWDVNRADGSSAIVGRTYAGNGVAAGDLFVVTEQSAGGVLGYPTLSGAGNGGIVVSWTQQGNMVLSDSSAVYQQLIDANGHAEFGVMPTGVAPAATTFTVQTMIGGDQPHLDVNGRYLLNDPLSSGATVTLGHLGLVGTAEPGATVTIMSGATVLATVGVDDHGDWGADLQHLLNGVYHLQAVVTDVNGVASAASAAFDITVDSAVINGTAGADGADYWYDHGASLSPQTLNGGDGDDTLDGGGGNDTLAGGTGNDTYVVNANGVFVSEAPGAGIDTVRANAASYTLTANVENLDMSDHHGVSTISRGNELDNVITGGQLGYLYGMAGNDTLIGSATTNNYLDGGAGNDVEIGGAGTDRLGSLLDTGNDSQSGGAGDDFLNFGAGQDTMDGGEGIDSASYSASTRAVTVNLATGVANDGVDTDTLRSIENITGSQFADKLTGSSANNLINGNGGDDTIDGGAGIDTASYGAATGAVTVNLATGIVSGGAGNDRLTSIENVTGAYNYANNITGDANANYLRGGKADDTIKGAGGNDTIDGEYGVDTAVYTGLKTDYLISTNADGAVIVQDKRSGAPDGTDTLFNVDKLQFSNGTVTLTPVDHVVSGVVAGAQAGANMTMSWDGGYLVAFRSPGASGDSLFVRKYDIDGIASDTNLLVANQAGGSLAGVSLTYLNDFGHVLVYQRNPATGAGPLDPGWDVVVQRLDAAGHLVGAPAIVSSNTGLAQTAPVVGTFADGGYLVSWQSQQEGAGHDSGIYAQMFSASGARVGTEMHINTSTGGEQVAPVVGIGFDHFTVGWQGPASAGHVGYFMQNFDLGGNKLGGEQLVFEVGDEGGAAQLSPLQIAVSPSDGSAVLTWVWDANNDGNGVVMARAVTAEGAPSGPAFVVAAGSHAESSSVLVLYDSTYMVLWDAHPASGQSTIMGQHYAEDGSLLGAAFSISKTAAAGDKTLPHLVDLGDHLAVVWETDGLPGLTGGGGVYQQMIDYNGNAMNVTASSSTTAPAPTTLTVAGVTGGDHPVYDPASPQVDQYQLFALSSGASVGNGHLVLSGTAAYGGSVEIKSGGTSLGTVGVDDSGKWVMDLTALALGTYSLTAVVRDVYGQASAASNAFNVTVNAGTINGTDGNDGAAYWIAHGANGSNQALNGGFGSDTLPGGGGSDTLDGGAGKDWADYSGATQAVTVNLANGTATHDGNAHDTLVNIEYVAGSAFADVITGSGGDDVIQGGGGNDTLDGGSGTDLLNYYTPFATGNGVTVSLQTGVASGGAGNDQISNFENVTGSSDNDSITGNTGANVLDGFWGNDSLRGGGGDDTLAGGGGYDQAYYSGNKANYAISTAADGSVVVTDLRGGSPDGTDHLSGIDRLVFADGAIDLTPIDQVVNNSTAGYQIQPVTTALDGGGYVTAFRAADGSGDGLFLRIFDENGVPKGGDIAITDAAGEQRNATLVRMDDGGFYVGYSANPAAGVSGNNANWENYLQRYDADGNKVGVAMMVNTTTDYAQRFPSVTALANGGVVVTWQGYQEGAEHDSGIYAQKFDSQGNKVGGEVHVNAVTAGDQVSPTALALGDGYVVTWVDGTQLKEQRFDGAGNKLGGELSIFSDAGAIEIGQAQLSATADGGFVAAWTTYSEDNHGAAWVRTFDAAGQPKGNAVMLDNSAGASVASVQGLFDNSYMVVWDHGSQVLGQRFLNNGSAAGEPFTVSHGAAEGYAQNPSLALLENGKLVVSWMAIDVMANAGIYQQIIGWDGHPELFYGNSDMTPPAAPAFSVQTVVGGAQPEYTVAGSIGYLQLHAALSGGATISNNHLVVSGTAAFGSTVTLQDGGHMVTTGVDDSGHWAVELSGLNDGSHAIVATVQNAQGVFSASSAAFAFTVDSSVLNGTSGDDGVAWWMDQGANGSAQTLNGGSGNDTLDGNGGYDTLNGGAGDDTYLIHNGAQVNEAPGEGIDTVVMDSASGGMTMGENIENLTSTGSFGHFIQDNALDNVIRASDGGDFIVTGDGNDTVYGNGGGDNFVGGAGNDVLYGGDGDDYFITDATNGNDLMDGGAGNDYFEIAPGQDTIAGGDGYDTLYTQYSSVEHGVSINLATGVIADNGFGGTGSIGGVEEVQGTQFADVLTGSGADEVFVGNGGNDTIDGGGGIDKMIYGGAAAVSASLLTGLATGSGGTIQFSNMEGLGGGGGNDNLVGDGGANVLSGLLGNDTITGGAGNDTIDGGGGFDTAVYSGNKADYNISTANGIVTVQDKRGGSPDGTDSLTGIRSLKFADGNVELKAVDHVVSSNPGGYQIYQGTAAHWYRDAGFIEVFRASDASGDGLYARAFDESGNALGNDILINAGNTGGDQRAPVVSSLVFGGYAVVYHSNPALGAGYDDSGWDVMVQVLDNSGHPVGAAVNVGTTEGVADRLPSVTGLDFGGFVVTWQSAQAGDDQHLAIYSRSFGAQGQPYGPETLVGMTSNSDQTTPVVTNQPGNCYVITWSGITASGHYGYIEQRFDNLGNKTGGESIVYETADAVATLSPVHSSHMVTGGHVLSWIFDADGSGTGEDVVMARNYDADGNPVGAAFVVATAGQQHSTAVLGLSDGSYMVVWDAENADGSSAIMGRRYSGSDNSALTDEFKISNSPAAGVRVFPTLAEFQNGEIVVSWGTQGAAELTGSGGIYQQIIDFNGAPSFYNGDSSTTKPAATTITVQTVVGGAQPVLDPAYPSAAYYLKDAPLTSGATVSNSHLVVSGTAAVGSLVTVKAGALVLGTVAVDDDGRWALDVASMGSGTYALTATVTDMFGKVSDASNTFNLVVNGTAITGTAVADGESYWFGHGANGTAQNLTGLGGNDTLNGGGGNDTLAGGAGDDTYIVNNTGVTIVEAAAAGTDTVVATVSTILAANVENLTLGGGAGLTGTGNALNNVITGTSGDDLLNGMAGTDTISGGAGNDTYVVDVAGDTVIEASNAGIDTVQVAFTAAGTYVLGQNIENATVTATVAVNLTGNALDNVLTGNAAANILIGDAGNDTLNGGAGNDSMTGGSGDDVYSVDAAGDVVTEALSGGYDTVNTTLAAYTLAANVEKLHYSGTGSFNGTGNAADNVIEGSVTGNDTLGGGAGADTLFGYGGNDSLSGGDNDDILLPGVGTDTVDGGAGIDTMVVMGNFNDYARSRINDTDIRLVNSITGENIVFRNIELVQFADGVRGMGDITDNSASPGNDTLIGTDGNDTIDGGLGNDSMSGGLGDDVYLVSAPGDVVVENPGEGHDTVQVFYSVAGTYTLAANVEDAIVKSALAVNLTGNGENNLLTGNAVANILTGNGGADTLVGGGGADTLVGGIGNDTYVVAATGAVITELANQGSDSVQTSLATYTLGANLENLTYTGGTTFNGIGNELNNVIGGGAGNDSLNGGAGNDTLLGNGGNDSLSGGAGLDVLVGGAGNDTLDGGVITDLIGYSDANVVNYGSSTAGVFVNLATGVAQDGMGGNDKLVNINFVQGSNFNDVLVGGTTLQFEQFEGGAGDDTIDGGLVTDTRTQENNNRVTYQNATSGVTVDLDAGTADGDSTGHDTLFNITQARGSKFDDTLLGSDSTLTEQFEGGDGDDLIDGQGGIDLVRYDNATAGVTVNLADGTATGASTGTDTLVDIEGVRGSAFADVLIGGNPANGVDVNDGLIEIFIGNGGDDVIDGGDGYDRVDYTTSKAGVSIDLGAGTAQDGLGGNDTLSNIEGVRGSSFNDTLVGSDADFESFEGRAGNDQIDGKGGVDRVDYQNAGAAVVVNLQTGTATDGEGGTDTLANIENVRGTDFNDNVTGNAGNNKLEGLSGNDTLNGGAGDDTLLGGAGNDSLLGGDGNDRLSAGGGAADVADGGAGVDTLVLSGDFADYTRTRLASGDLVLVNAVTGENVTARNVEMFEFSDGMRSFGDVIVNIVSPAGDLLVGDGGNNTLDGGASSDTMSGGAGDDTYVVDVATDVVRENPSQGTDQVNVAFTAAGVYTLTANVENATVTSTLAVGLVGNDIDNVLTGNAAANALTGNGGNDTLIGGAGADTMAGGAGDDVYVVDVAGDVVTEAASAGTDRVETALAAYTLGVNVENLAYEGTANFNGTGNALDNEITGGIGNDTLNGGVGNDTLNGGAGSDSLLGGDGDDQIDAGTGAADVADGGLGNDTLHVIGDFADYTRTRVTATDTKLVNVVTGESVTLRNIETVMFDDGGKTLAEVNDNLASVGSDSLTGTAGNDTINGGTGSDTMAGGDGDDVYVIDVLTDLVNENPGEGNDTVQVAFTAAGAYTLTANVENATVTSTVAVSLTGNSLANVLTGNAAANKLTGLDGNDTLIGGAGVDTMIGGSGDDVYVVDVAGDVVTEAANDGTDRVETALASYSLGVNVENLTYKGTAAFNGTGNSLANEIIGGNGNDTINGGLGNDTLRGGAGNDSLLGGDGDDQIYAGVGATDVADGGNGDDTVYLAGDFSSYTRTRVTPTDTKLVNVVTGESVTLRGIETVVFHDGDKSMAEVNDNLASGVGDLLIGTAGNDTLNGGVGNDTMNGLDGDDVYVVDVGADVINENIGEGNDTVQVAYLAVGTYTLGANLENATVTSTVAISLFGNELDNILTGNAAANKLTGNAGNDTLNGGAGADTMIGGLGNDVYVVDVAGDVVTEAIGEGVDRVETALAAYALGANMENLSYKGAVNFSGTGNALANEIIGGIGNDTLNGGADNDTLRGGAGNDSLLGGDGDDHIYAGTGLTDIADGGGGNDTLHMAGDFGDYVRTRVTATDTKLVSISTGESVTLRNIETVMFDDGSKTMTEVNDNLATASNDTLNGTSGNDTINGGAGSDSMSGREGDDTYVVDVVGDVVVENANEGNDTVLVGYAAASIYTLGNNVENATVTSTVAISLVGNGLDNILTGNAAANKLTGNDGNDTLVGGAGVDTMIGGLGDDVYVVDVAGDVVTEAANEGVDRVETTLATYTLGATLENLTYKGTVNFSGTGNALNNEIIGGIGNDTLTGGAGNDTLRGNGGNDSLIGGAGDDLLVAGAGVTDLADGGLDTDTLQVLGNFDSYTRTRVTLTDTRLVNSVTGESVTLRNIESVVFADGVKSLYEVNYNLATTGNDALIGTNGNDVLNGGAGVDTMLGGDGSDTYVVDVADEMIIENADQGIDLVNVAFAAAAVYTLGANLENATVTSTAAISLVGNELDNVLTGNAAGNALTGLAGNDTLIGGAGNDTMAGGTGDDVYRVDAAGDVVTELTGAGTDRVETTLATYTLAANVENLAYVGTAAFNGTGNALDNLITGGNGNDTLTGGVGNDTLVGGTGNDSLVGGVGTDLLVGEGGNDTLVGGADGDVFVLNGTGLDNVTDFVSGTDKVIFSEAVLNAVGNGNGSLDGFVLRSAPGGFEAGAELVLFTQNATAATPAAAAAVIGSASGAYTLGQQALFVVDNGTNSYVYLFKSNGTDALVSAAELTQIAVLTGSPTTTLSDYQLVA